MHRTVHVSGTARRQWSCWGQRLQPRTSVLGPAPLCVCMASTSALLARSYLCSCWERFWCGKLRGLSLLGQGYLFFFPFLSLFASFYSQEIKEWAVCQSENKQTKPPKQPRHCTFLCFPLKKIPCNSEHWSFFSRSLWFSVKLIAHQRTKSFFVRVFLFIINLV